LTGTEFGPQFFFGVQTEGGAKQSSLEREDYSLRRVLCPQLLEDPGTVSFDRFDRNGESRPDLDVCFPASEAKKDFILSGREVST
jgi:hypothetical protein